MESLKEQNVRDILALADEREELKKQLQTAREETRTAHEAARAERNAARIASKDVPKMEAEIVRLKAEGDRLRTALQDAQTVKDKLEAERRQNEAVVANLHEELKARDEEIARLREYERAVKLRLEAHNLATSLG